MKQHGLFPVLATKPFLLLWLAEIFSQVAFYMLNFLVVFVVFELTNSSTAVSGIVLTFTIPAMLFGILAGAYVDRWDKKAVLLTTTLLRAVLSVLLALSYRNVALVYMFTFLLSLVTQFFIPAEIPMIPLLVRREHLLSANALFGMGVQGSILVAFALSGPFLILFRKTYIFLILALFFLAASALVYFIRVPRRRTYEEETTSTNLYIKDELMKTFAVISNTKAIYRSLFLLGFSQILLLIIAVIGPSFANEILKLDAEGFLLLFVTPAALGMVVGAVAIGNFLFSASRSILITTGLFTAGGTMALLPFASQEVFVLLPILAIILGFANALIFVPANTIVQENTSDALRGKVYGALNALSGLASLLPVILTGSLSDIFGVSKVIVGIGVAILAVAVVYVFSQ